ncbi:putative Zn peptidase [Gottschalkia purinilytica]|uniref:Putative Zn peptidase n=1 Tax=Gottschalkia purinilytica TaxID=1503 RepID=A0A0L0WD04_GOTPU|nr:ImmA/IrrE family metallo-endopeptidase [Gottschalkia purinilytica]KNF09326.1 putative Zn peptidase [Gottschalkia purinilytica]
MTLEDLIFKQHPNHLEDKANLILIENNINYPWEINLEQIISKYKNITLLYANQCSKTIIRKNKSIIVMDNRLPFKEHRQELAEEFCHVLLHCGNQAEYIKSILLDKQESQAKRMSAYLLCPMFMLKKLKFIDNTYLMIEELAEHFNVTYEFMEYRLALIFGQDLSLIVHHRQRFYGYMPIK